MDWNGVANGSADQWSRGARMSGWERSGTREMFWGGGNGGLLEERGRGMSPCWAAVGRKGGELRSRALEGTAPPPPPPRRLASKWF